MAIVRLRAQGWTVKAIAGYLGINRDTLYKTLKRFIEEGEAGLEDRKRGRPKGVCKVDLKAIDAVRRLQKNPALGEFRVHAALAQVGIHLSPRTCGRILWPSIAASTATRSLLVPERVRRRRCPSPL
jgi:putative transposase